MLYIIIAYSVVRTNYMLAADRVDAAKVDLVWSIVFMAILGLKLLAA